MALFQRYASRVFFLLLLAASIMGVLYFVKTGDLKIPVTDYLKPCDENKVSDTKTGSGVSPKSVEIVKENHVEFTSKNDTLVDDKNSKNIITPTIDAEKVISNGVPLMPPAWDEIFDNRTRISPTDPRVLRYLHMYRLFPPPTASQIARQRKPKKKKYLSKIQDLVKANDGGFFVECGANDGEFLSRSLSLETDFGWTGLLIEASPSYFKKLKSRRRNAWTANVCLSGEIEKNEFKMNPNKAESWMQGTGVIDPGKKYRVPVNFAMPELDPEHGLDMEKFSSEGMVDCFPLHSLLAAIGRRTVDYFTLDIQGHEFQVLKGIPFNEVDIKVITAEYHVTPEGKDAIRKLMEQNGYKVFEDDGENYTFQKNSSQIHMV